MSIFRKFLASLVLTKANLKIAALASLLFNLITNGFITLLKYEVYKVNFFSAIFELAKDQFYLFIANFLLFFGLSFHKYLFTLGSLSIFMLGAISSYYIYQLNITISPEIIRIALQNGSHDVLELINIKCISFCIVSFCVWLLFIQHYFKATRVRSSIISDRIANKVLTLICLIAVIWVAVHPPFRMLKNYLPWQILNSAYLFATTPKSANKIVIHELDDYLRATENEQITVLVIGESARYDHFAINGYNRNTTPQLTQLENIYSFKTTSCANLTYLSVSCFLSRWDTAQFKEEFNETTLISIFKKLGFNTAWFGTQNLHGYFKDQIGGSFYDEVDLLMLSGGSSLLQTGDYDGKLLPFFENYLNSKQGSKFIVLHTSGSHWDFSKRYPKEFAQFTPICPTTFFGKKDPTDCTKEELTNIYDNSILYTDHFLSEVIKLLKDKRAIMIYVSDHGESLGEDGFYGHGHPNRPEQYSIPFIFWASTQFWRDNPRLKPQLEKLKDRQISHDFVFHSLLACSNITAETINPNLSLCPIK